MWTFQVGYGKPGGEKKALEDFKRSNKQYQDHDKTISDLKQKYEKDSQDFQGQKVQLE